MKSVKEKKYLKAKKAYEEAKAEYDKEVYERQGQMAIGGHCEKKFKSIFEE